MPRFVQNLIFGYSRREIHEADERLFMCKPFHLFL
jgi:hypothetical protein